jgi:hypothetical protein
METRSTILNELNGISPTVAQAGNNMPYQVPQGYFEGLAEMVLQRIRTQSLNALDETAVLSPLLSGLSKKMPFEVPADYFSELSGNVADGVKAIDFVKEELEGVSPMLRSLRTKNVYQVPQGYFENLADNILDKVRDRRPAKVVSMGRKVMRYAVAAVFAGALAIGGWFYFNNNTGVEQQQIAGTEKISDDAKVSDEEMTDFLENESMPLVLNTSVTEDADMDETAVKEMLADISEDELQQFLKTL